MIMSVLECIYLKTCSCMCMCKALPYELHIVCTTVLAICIWNHCG